MPIDWQPFVDWVHTKERFLLLTHIRPDADALGSLLGMADALTAVGKTAYPVINGALPERFQVIDPEGQARTYVAPGEAAWRECDAAIVLDTGTWNQLGPAASMLKAMAAERAVIDHHRTQDEDLAKVRCVEVPAEATGRLVWEASQALGVDVGPLTASRLFAALATDTGWFHHSNTRPDTFALAAELGRRGADAHELYNAFYEQASLGRMRLLGRVIERVQTGLNGFVAWTELTQKDLAETGVESSDSGDFVGYPRSVAGVEVAMLLMEMPNGRVKVSFRSRGNVDVSALAEAFGGGGHKQAAAANVPGDLARVRAALLAALEAHAPAVLPAPPAAEAASPL